MPGQNVGAVAVQLWLWLWLVPAASPPRAAQRVPVRSSVPGYSGCPSAWRLFVHPLYNPRRKPASVTSAAPLRPPTYACIHRSRSLSPTGRPLTPLHHPTRPCTYTYTATPSSSSPSRPRPRPLPALPLLCHVPHRDAIPALMSC
jgi:hypothetical protein